jgi:hypothetical protein
VVWLVSALLALLIVSLLAVVVPGLFGSVASGFAPLLALVAVIGLGGAWWRHSRHRVDAEVTDDSDEPAQEERRGEDEHVET